MRKIFSLLLFLTVLIVPHMVEAATTITNARWLTRNDAAISYVRIVLDLTNPVKVDATISKDGLTTQLVLHDAYMPSAPKRILMNPKILNNAIFAESKGNVVITMETPHPLDPSDMHVFFLRKGLAVGKPARLVIDVKQKNVAPRTTFFGQPKPSPKRNRYDRTPYSESGPYRIGGGIKGKIIAIDPGHGGSDPGSIAKNGTQEKQITLPIAMELKRILESKGAKVVMTRTTDKDVYGAFASGVDELQARADVGNTNRADVFISIHINSFTNPNVSGIADYYYQKTPYDKKFAQFIQKQIAGQPNMGGDRGTNEAGLYVLDHTNMPATLVELGFMSNPGEVEQLKNPQVQKEFAERIFRGIQEYFNS